MYFGNALLLSPPDDALAERPVEQLGNNGDDVDAHSGSVLFAAKIDNCPLLFFSRFRDGYRGTKDA